MCRSPVVSHLITVDIVIAHVSGNLNVSAIISFKSNSIRLHIKVSKTRIDLQVTGQQVRVGINATNCQERAAVFHNSFILLLSGFSVR